MPVPADVVAWATRVGSEPTARYAVVADLARRGQRDSKSADIAEDCLQDALAVVLRRGEQDRLPPFRDYGQFRCYVIRAAIIRAGEVVDATAFKAHVTAAVALDAPTGKNARLSKR